MYTMHLCCYEAKLPNLKVVISAQAAFRLSPVLFNLLSGNKWVPVINTQQAHIAKIIFHKHSS
jgi:hypothetical protein